MTREATVSPQNAPPAVTPASGPKRPGLRRYFATSEGSAARAVRFCYRAFRSFSVPAPAIVVKPLAWMIVTVRSIYYSFLRIFICEPFFKAHCKRYGRNLHTDCYLHWISGKGDIVVGDDVIIEGKCTIVFAARFSDRPLLQFGDRSGAGHDCRFVIGRSITIGADTMIAGGVTIHDSNGHPTDPQARLLHLPPDADEVRPVTIGKGVWIGRQSMIFPGVRIGDGSVVAAGSVVRTHVPPYSVVAGNPARVMFRLKPPAPKPAQSEGAP